MKETVITHKYHIPKNYYKPAMLVIRLRMEKGIPFNRAVDIAVASFTADPKAPDYIPKDKLHRNKLAEHVLKSIANEW